MKKILLIFAAAAMFFPSVSFSATNISKTTAYPVYVPTSTPAVGQAVTVNIKFVNQTCCGIPADSIKLTITGGATLSTTTTNLIMNKIPPDTYQSFTIRSTKAGTMTLTGKEVHEGQEAPNTLSFGTITYKSATTSTTAKTTTKTKVTIAPPKPKPPTTPLLTDLKLDGNLFQTSNDYQYEIGKAIAFSGKTIANGKVTLTFNSEPFTDTTTADANGNWTYTLTKNLGEGEHTMTYAVTDPATNLTSAPTEPVNFSLVAAAKTETTTAVEPKNYTWWYVVSAGILMFILFGVLGFFAWNRRARKVS